MLISYMQVTHGITLIEVEQFPVKKLTNGKYYPSNLEMS